MGKKNRGCKIQRDVISGILQHFGQKEEAVKRAFLKDAGLKTSDMRTAATADCLPAQAKWKSIQTSAIANGWTAEHN